MIGRHQRLLILCGFLLVMGLALWPERWSPPAYASVTLVSFTATSVPGQREIGIDWETATEVDTSGFFVASSASSAGPFRRVSDFIVAAGSTVVGAQYHFTDTTTVWNRIYYYRLEVINSNQTIDYHGPISAIAGPATSTPTTGPPPTATPTMPPATDDVEPTLSTNGGPTVTPRLAIGATITPRPTASPNSSSNPVAFAQAPTLSAALISSPLPTPLVSTEPAAPDAATVVTAPPPIAANVARALVPTLAAPDAAPAVVEPIVIAPETASRTTSTNSTNSGALILIAAAILLLGLALLILRQARQ